MSNSLSSRAIGANEAEARLPESQRERSIALFHHGTLTVKLYAPRGNVLFVPAGMEHRFENFRDDLAVWVFFYGPEGGEAET